MRSLSMFFPLSNSMLGTQDGTPQFPRSWPRCGTELPSMITSSSGGMAGAALHTGLTFAASLLVLVFAIGLALLLRQWCSSAAPLSIFPLVLCFVLCHGKLRGGRSHTKLTRSTGLSFLL